MAIPAAVASAKTSLINSATKDLKKIGEKFLVEFLGCKVKPKGTPHVEVWRKAPKFFYTYGIGVVGDKSFKPHSSGFAIFDIQTGYFYERTAEVDLVFPREERRKVEAGLRKKCETTTGDFSLFVEVRNPETFRGYVRLKDGLLYDAAMYNTNGGSRNNPISLNIERKRISGEVDARKVEGQTPTGVNPLALAIPLLYFFMKK